MPRVYGELRRLAEHYMRRERGGHTLQATAVVHEAFLRLVGKERAQVRDREHFFAVAAQAMRRVLVDHARRVRANKRSGERVTLTLERVGASRQTTSVDVLALDEALTALAKIDERQARVVELRYFGGLTLDETAQALSLSVSTVERFWRVSRLWLRRKLGDAPKTGGES